MVGKNVSTSIRGGKKKNTTTKGSRFIDGGRFATPKCIGVLKKCHSQMYWSSWELLAANLRLHGGNSWIDPRKDASGIPETQNVRNSGEDLHPG